MAYDKQCTRCHMDREMTPPVCASIYILKAQVASLCHGLGMGELRRVSYGGYPTRESSVAVALKITSEGLEFVRVAVLERTLSSTNGPGSWVIQPPSIFEGSWINWGTKVIKTCLYELGDRSSHAEHTYIIDTCKHHKHR
jgi:hypothetical protein